jgi:predicted RNase H-like HicB family nuclease
VRTRTKAQESKSSIKKMIFKYLKSAMMNAYYERLEEDDSFYGEILGFQGVYANEATLEECRDELESVLEDWILFSIKRNFTLPLLN